MSQRLTPTVEKIKSQQEEYISLNNRIKQRDVTAAKQLEKIRVLKSVISDYQTYVLELEKQIAKANKIIRDNCIWETEE